METQQDSIARFDTLLQGVLIQLRIDRPGFWSPKLEGILPMDLHILECAMREPEIILKEIREELDIPNSTLTSAIDRLEQRGLLLRKVSARDRRSYGLELTEQGILILREHERVHRQVAETLLNQLSAEEQKTLTLLLQKLQVGLKKTLMI